MNDIIQRIYEIGIVPVIALDDAEKAVPLAQPPPKRPSSASWPRCPRCWWAPAPF